MLTRRTLFSRFGRLLGGAAILPAVGAAAKALPTLTTEYRHVEYTRGFTVDKTYAAEIEDWRRAYGGGVNGPKALWPGIKAWWAQAHEYYPEDCS